MKPSRLFRLLLPALSFALWHALVPGAALAAPSAMASFEQRCERDMLPLIEVRTRLQGYVVNNHVSSRVLTTRGVATYSGDALLGMTSSNTRAELSIDGPALADPAGGRECVAARIGVELSYQPLDVYVAREFQPASCSYREVFAHEMQHVKLYADNLPLIEQRVRDELNKRYGGKPLYAPRGTGLTALHDQISGWLPALIRVEMARVEAQQRALDSRDETERLSHMCLGEIASRMGSSF